MDDATLAQVRAADPIASTWLSANAGSGKTKVLTDRVARLLLNGTPPQRILCLTYTKAAASEMQNRLFKRLGGWSMLEDAKLIDALVALGEPAPDAERLRQARRLFAGAIEAPGGLKIQTIHAFCASLLRRFPLEAGVAPDFAEADARSLKQLRRDLLDSLSEGPHRPVVQALFEVVGETKLDDAIAELGKQRDTIVLQHDLDALFGLPRGLTEEALAARIFTGEERDALHQIIAALNRLDEKAGAIAKRLAAFSDPGFAHLPQIEAFCLTGADAKDPHAPKALGNKAQRAALPAEALGIYDAFVARVAEARPLRTALAARRAAEAVQAFARIWLPAYDQAKAARRWLDFDDLIRLAQGLLENPSVAQWVLFKLDGGIDHILVDEAQDTSPAQWQVIRHLAQEFTAGRGARDIERTIFIVGDRKQSIYSFQGADLTGYDRTRQGLAEGFAAIGQNFSEMALRHSFRSSDAILRMVDAAFSTVAGSDGLGEAPSHLAFFAARPGRVDIWPPLERPDKADDAPWFDPVDRVQPGDASQMLGRHIARHIRATIDAGTCLPDGDGARLVHEGDFLVLVRKRGPLFRGIIRACKEEGLAVAGADRLDLLDELAVQDILSVLRFLALPEDDLSLAIALRSPIFGWSEDRLFRLATGRGSRPLWTQLRQDVHAATENAILRDLLDQVDFLRPYEILERLLTRHQGRARLIARLGDEVRDAIDALVELALVYERESVPSLDGFLCWLEASEAEVKRQAESAGRRIRVMTVHGAKGLEAPIVILPESVGNREALREVLGNHEGAPLVRAAREAASEAQRQSDTAATQLREAENDRLLYVALTRAENWLILAIDGEPKDHNWYPRVAEAMDGLGALPLQTPVGPGRRFEHGDWPPNMPAEGRIGSGPVVSGAGPVDLPDLPPAHRLAPVLSPTGLGGAKALPGDGDDTRTAMARGDLIHRLLEVLPDVPRAAWRDEADRLAAASDCPVDLQGAAIAEALSVLETPALGRIFGPDSLGEVAISGRWQGEEMAGVIDRLVIGDDHVLIVDFKSNRVVPVGPEAIPEGLLRQLGAYCALVAPLYPGCVVEAAILWTTTGELMGVPPASLDMALARAALEGRLERQA